MNEVGMREKQITRTSIIGIGANICLAAFKMLCALLSGSIAILMDAVNNLTDALSSVITIVGIKLAKRAPDNKHPFGYGRIEYFSAIIIAGIVLFAGITSLIESVEKVIHPEMPDFTAVTIIIVAVAVAAKIVLGRFVSAQGKKYNSDALVASGADATFDAVISASTLVGAAITLIFHISVDGIVGSIISLFIIKAGVEMLMQPVNAVIGNRYDSEITMEIKAAIREMEGVNGAYDLVLHDYGPDSAIGSVHVEIPADMTAGEIHKLTMAIQEMVSEKFHVFLTVGIYAMDEAHAPHRAKIREVASAHEGVLGTHGVFWDDEWKKITFDAVIDFTVHDKDALNKTIAEEIGALYPGYQVTVNFDANYSD